MLLLIFYIIVASAARDSIFRSNHFPCYTHSPTFPMLIILELGGSGGCGAVGCGAVGCGANPLLPNSSQTIRNFQKAIMQDGCWQWADCLDIFSTSYLPQGLPWDRFLNFDIIQTIGVKRGTGQTGHYFPFQPYKQKLNWAIDMTFFKCILILNKYAF